MRDGRRVAVGGRRGTREARRREIATEVIPRVPVTITRRTRCLLANLIVCNRERTPPLPTSGVAVSMS